MHNGHSATNSSKRSSTVTLTRSQEAKPTQSDLREQAKAQWTKEPATYYDLPLIKKAHWSWEVVLYLFLGGLAGGTSLVTTLVHLLGSERDKTLVRAGRYISLVCMLLSPILLIKDLGRPERFLHMLRVLKLRSAMSLGSWGITFFGIFSGLLVIYQMAQDGLLNWLPWLARMLRAMPIRVLASITSFIGMFVASYTGVLLSSTAVPLWGRARHILGPLFLTSGLSTGLASLSLVEAASKADSDTLDRLESAEFATMLTELSLIASIRPTLGPLAEPLFKGKTGVAFSVGTVGGGLLLPLLLRLVWRLSGRKPTRSMNIGTSLLVLLGGLIMRYAWVAAGRASADDPRATHYYNNVESRG